MRPPCVAPCQAASTTTSVLAGQASCSDRSVSPAVKRFIGLVLDEVVCEVGIDGGLTLEVHVLGQDVLGLLPLVGRLPAEGLALSVGRIEVLDVVLELRLQHGFLALEQR